MRTVALIDLPAKREELLDGLAQGEAYTVTDEGREIATLTPPHAVVNSPEKNNAFELIADLIGTEEGPQDLSNKKKHLANFGLDNQARRKAKEPLSPE